MKTEIRTITVIHPELGELTKRNKYTWDETVYPTWEDAKENEGFVFIEFVPEDDVMSQLTPQQLQAIINIINSSNQTNNYLNN